MLTLDFPGSRTLIGAIGAVVTMPNTRDLIDSLHIYSGPMMRCAVFQPLPEDCWYGTRRAPAGSRPRALNPA